MAVEYLLSLGQEGVWDRIQKLAAQLRQKLAALPGVTVLDRGRTLCGIVSFNLVSSPAPSKHPRCTASTVSPSDMGDLRVWGSESFLFDCFPVFSLSFSQSGFI